MADTSLPFRLTIDVFLRLVLVEEPPGRRPGCSPVIRDTAGRTRKANAAAQPGLRASPLVSSFGSATHLLRVSGILCYTPRAARELQLSSHDVRVSDVSCLVWCLVPCACALCRSCTCLVSVAPPLIGWTVKARTLSDLRGISRGWVPPS